MICGKCHTEQDLIKIDIDEKVFTYYCPKCKDRISPSSCYTGKVKEEQSRYYVDGNGNQLPIKKENKDEQ